MPFKLSNLNSNLVRTLSYLNPALNNSALDYKFLGNCAPTPPLCKHFNLNEK